jgi:outer membrane protein OmpA-like peptidoglycan-associated protein
MIEAPHTERCCVGSPAIERDTRPGSRFAAHGAPQHAQPDDAKRAPIWGRKGPRSLPPSRGTARPDVSSTFFRSERLTADVRNTPLALSPPSNPAEHEADAVAGKVITGSQVDGVNVTSAASGVVSRKCDACTREDEENEPVMRAAAPSSGEPLCAQLARKESGRPSSIPAIPSIVDDVIRSPGAPLDSASRAFMEPRFGRSFGDVRIHADSEAAESARSVNALAYTVGPHIVFGPEKSPRKHPQLLAHELVHVQQQRAAAGAMPLEMGEPSAPEEVEADRLADDIMNGSNPDGPLQAASPRLRRWVSCASTPFTGMELEPTCPPREPGEVARSRSGLSVGSISDPETGEIVFGFAVGSSNASGLASDPTWRSFSSSIASASSDRWEILGFTDCEGPESFNADLRRDRANKVFAQLAPAAKAQIDNAAGAPMTDCVAVNETESNRKFNRSVVFRRTSRTVTFPAESITGIQCPPTAAITATDLGDYIALMQCAEARMGLGAREMLTVFRQIYYGKPWSNSKTSLWDRVIQCSAAVGDPQPKLGTPLFESLKKSQEVAGVDVGHVFAGLEAMTCPTAEVSFPVAGGLVKAVAAMPNEAFATWGGDLGAAAAAHVACDQLGSAAASKGDCGMKPPPQTLRFYFDHHAPAQDLEGDIDAFIVRASEEGITCASSRGATFTPSRAISEIFADAYINSTSKLGVLHQNRYECMLQLLGATVSGKRVTNRAAVESKLMSQVASFADLFFTKIKGGGFFNVSDASDRRRMETDSSNMLDMFIDYLESKL